MLGDINFCFFFISFRVINEFSDIFTLFSRRHFIDNNIIDGNMILQPYDKTITFHRKPK